MPNRTSEIAPNVYARSAGIAYLIIIIAGLIGEMFIRNKLIVSGNAAATAANIANSELLWRIGIAGDLLMHICDVIVMIGLYVLLKPVNRNLALMAMLFTLIQTAVLVANKMTLMMPLFLSGNAEYLKVFSNEQLQSLSYVFVKAHGYGFGIGLIFFSFECFINGYLIFKSGFFPKALGIMLQVAGLCYLVNSTALIINPSLADKLFPAILLPPFIAELSLCLWLIIKGVNVQKWNSYQSFV
jgi:hypothetical protein